MSTFGASTRSTRGNGLTPQTPLPVLEEGFVRELRKKTVLVTSRGFIGWVLGRADREQQIPGVAGGRSQQGRNQRNHPAVGKQPCVAENRAPGNHHHSQVAQGRRQLEQVAPPSGTEQA